MSITTLFNAATLVDAAEGWKTLLDGGRKMFLTIAGAMSTAELGLSLAEMIRRDKVHAIKCTGANLEEDVFNLVAHEHYVRVPHYRELSPAEETALHDRHLNRVTDTCIPEEEAIRRIERAVLEDWRSADKEGKRFFPHEFIYRILLSGKLKGSYQIDPKDSWLLAAAEKKLPMFVPGWEDSTLGNIFAAHCIENEIMNGHTVRTGIEYMTVLAEWYTVTARESPIGFFQIGGGIAGDFPICVVPMLHQDLRREGVPLWANFCQISDSTTSLGSYSGAVPNEKITWGKVGEKTPKFIIESDGTIVAPLVFAVVLGWQRRRLTPFLEGPTIRAASGLGLAGRSPSTASASAAGVEDAASSGSHEPSGIIPCRDSRRWVSAPDSLDSFGGAGSTCRTEPLHLWYAPCGVLG